MIKKTKDDICENVIAKYDILDRIGKGAYGVVYKSYDKLNNTLVAVKRVYDVLTNKYDSEWLYREILLLENFKNHPNIIKLLDVIKSSNDRDVYLVFEYIEANLFNVIRANILTEPHIQFLTYQLLKALKYIHSADIMNRDLKPQHILLNKDCRIKIDDFALAKSSNDESSFKITDYIQSRWYRAPEILLEARKYGKEVDIWAVGCILGEMLIGKTVFPGYSTMNQLELIIQLIGKPKPEEISIKESLASGMLNNITIPLHKQKTFKAVFCNASITVLDLLEKLLKFDPSDRITVDEALEHDFFKDIRNKDEEIIMETIITFDVTEEQIEEINNYKLSCLKKVNEEMEKLNFTKKSKKNK